MIVFSCIVDIVLIIVLVRAKRENADLKVKAEYLYQQLCDLQRKTYYNYKQIQRLNGEVIHNENESSQEQKTACTADTVVKEDEPLVQHTTEVTDGSQATDTEIKSHENTNPYARQIPIEEYTSPIFKDGEEDKPQTVHNVVASQNSESPYAVRSDSIRKKDKKQINSFESWFGTRVYNIAASLMIFIGLVLFCTLGYEYVNDTVKMVVMFLVSGCFVGIGAYFTKKKKSVFSLSLTGCGFGAFFISVLVSNVYFGVLGDISAMLLLLAWSAAALYLSKRLDSVTLSVTAHMGTAVSICFILSVDLPASQANFIVPFIYQLAAIAVLTLGNIFCCRRTYRFGLFMSLVLLDYTSIVISYKFYEAGVFPNVISPAFLVTVLALQFAAVSFASYLLSVSLATLLGSVQTNKRLITVAHGINKLIWFFGTYFTVGTAALLILKRIFLITGYLYLFAVGAVIVGHLFITLYLSEKLNFNEKLARVSVWVNSVIISIVLFVAASGGRSVAEGLPFVFVYTLFIIAVIRYTKLHKLNSLVITLLAGEAIYLIIEGYWKVENYIIVLLYMIALCATAFVQWLSLNDDIRKKYLTSLKTAEYSWVSITTIPLAVAFAKSLKLDKAGDIFIMSFMAAVSLWSLLNLVTYFCGYAKSNEKTLKSIMTIESMSVIVISIINLFFKNMSLFGDFKYAKVIFFILVLLLTGVYAMEFIMSKSSVKQFISVIMISLFITAFCSGLGYDFKISQLYIDTLEGIPFFFISALLFYFIYRVRGNTKFSFPIIITSVISMLFMCFVGYENLYFKCNGNTAAKVSVVAVGIAFTVLMAYMVYHAFYHKKRSITYLATQCAVYVLVNMSAGELFYELCSNYRFNSEEFALTAIFLINIIISLTKKKSCNKNVGRFIDLGMFVIIYVTAFIITSYISITEPYGTLNAVIRAIVIILMLGLFYGLARRYVLNNHIIIQMFIGFTATVVINAIFGGISNVFEVEYIFSIVTMITALICTIIGFTMKSKGLRVYGLVVVMLCIIKLVTLDITAADSMSRVVAFVLGGIICFIISGVYNKFENILLSSESEIKENTPSE